MITTKKTVLNDHIGGSRPQNPVCVKVTFHKVTNSGFHTQNLEDRLLNTKLDLSVIAHQPILDEIFQRFKY